MEGYLKRSAKRNECKGTVYHDSSVEKPQNTCSICGQNFLFQLQLRVHMEAHSEEEDSADEGNDVKHGGKCFESGSHTDYFDTVHVGHKDKLPDISRQLNDEVLHANSQSYKTNKSNESDITNVSFDTESDLIGSLTETHPKMVLENNDAEDANQEEIIANMDKIGKEDILVADEMAGISDKDDDNTMDFEYGTIEEINKNQYIKNDVNLGEVISQIKEGENNPAEKITTDSSGTEVIVMNKNIGKLNRKPDISKLKHECPVCNELFQWPYQLKRHVNIHNGYYPYECDICGRKFDRSSSLRDHGMVHRKDRPFKCEVCGVKFTLKNNLTKHMNRHTQKKIWQCEHCQKPFLQRDQLIAHLIVHKGERPFACEVCGKAFARKTNLKEHMITHSTEKNYPCDYCHKTFNKPYSKKIHMRHHLNTKPHKCDVCGASFSQSCALVTHIRRHTGERPFTCPMCPRSFAQQSTLQTHVATHTGEKNFKCGVCAKAFLRKRSLTEHMRLHTGEKPFKCMMCDFTTATKVGLKRHVETHVKQLIRNADIDLTGLIDLPHLDENNRLNKTDFSDLNATVINGQIAGAVTKSNGQNPDAGTNENQKPSDTSDPLPVVETNLSESIGSNILDGTENNIVNQNDSRSTKETVETHDILSSHVDSLEGKDNTNEESSISKIAEESIKQILNMESSEEQTTEPVIDEGTESLVYLTGLNLIVSEMNKHCNGKFDPSLLDEGFVRHIINQSSLLSQNSKKQSKEPTRFECEICKIVLPHKKSMTEHMKTHQLEPEVKTHKCELCNKTFLHRKSLLIHTRTHTGERPYKCDLCESTFTNKRSLQRHYMNLHKGIVVVKSAQEYAEALAERREIEDIDSPILETLKEAKSVQNKNKTKKASRSRKVSKSSVKKRNTDVDKCIVDNFERLEELNNTDMSIADNSELHVIEQTKGILKQAELAAKSICESLFGANAENSNLNESKPRNKRKSRSNKRKSHLCQNFSENVHTNMKKDQPETQGKKIAKDSYVVLRQALQSVEPVDDFSITESFQQHISVIKPNTFGETIQEEFPAESVIKKEPKDFEYHNLNDKNISENTSQSGNELTEDKLNNLGYPQYNSLANEYDALRKILQKSVNSVITPLIDDDM